jgi:hypothetical protein
MLTDHFCGARVAPGPKPPHEVDGLCEVSRFIGLSGVRSCEAALATYKARNIIVQERSWVAASANIMARCRIRLEN